MEYSLRRDEYIQLYLKVFIPIPEICDKIIKIKNDSENKDTLKYHIDRWESIAGEHYYTRDTHYGKFSYIFDDSEYIIKRDHRIYFYQMTGISYQIVDLILELIRILNDNSYDETWKPIEYRYDLCDMSYNASFPPLNDIISNYNNQGVVTENGYVVYNKCEFISYYGKEEGEKRWNSDIYSAPCFTEGDGVFLDPPIGCQFNYNISYLFVKCCLEYNNESDFNMNRAIIRKYVDVLWSFTDATDEIYKQKPIIKLRADYNNETFNLSCWHTFQYTNLYGEKRQNIEKIIKNFKSYGWDNSNMIDWVPSV